MKIAGVLLGGGKARRFGSPKLEALLDGERLVDRACRHFFEAGLAPVLFCGAPQPRDPRVLRAAAGATMIDTLRNGLRLVPDGAFAFAPADMPALAPGLISALAATFHTGEHAFLVPSHAGRRGHPAFARTAEPFWRLGDTTGAREVWREAGARLHHEVVDTADVLFDIDVPDDLAAATDARTRRARLVARGDLG